MNAKPTRKYYGCGSQIDVVMGIVAFFVVAGIERTLFPNTAQVGGIENILLFLLPIAAGYYTYRFIKTRRAKQADPEKENP